MLSGIFYVRILNTPIWRSRVSGETKASFLESDSE